MISVPPMRGYTKPIQSTWYKVREPNILQNARLQAHDSTKGRDTTAPDRYGLQYSKARDTLKPFAKPNTTYNVKSALVYSGRHNSKRKIDHKTSRPYYCVCNKQCITDVPKNCTAIANGARSSANAESAIYQQKSTRKKKATRVALGAALQQLRGALNCPIKQIVQQTPLVLTPTSNPLCRRMSLCRTDAAISVRGTRG